MIQSKIFSLRETEIKRQPTNYIKDFFLNFKKINYFSPIIVVTFAYTILTHNGRNIMGQRYFQPAK